MRVHGRHPLFKGSNEEKKFIGMISYMTMDEEFSEYQLNYLF